MEIDGRAVAAEILANIRAEVTRLAVEGWTPNLVSVAVGDSSAVRLYVRNQRRTAERLGIGFEERIFPESVSIEELQAAIHALNVDPRVTGVVLQRPIPPHLAIRSLQSAIHPLKDVEGMHPASIGRIVYQNCELAPCTALAAVELLRRTGLSLPGLEVTVIGHSEIVGKPIAFLLMSEGATVTVCHHMTRDVATHSRKADAVFVAVGKAGFLDGTMVKPGGAVIDIGINHILLDGKSKVVGDADFFSCRNTAGWITPVPGGVGPVTVAMLMRNTLTALNRLKTEYQIRLGDAAL